MGDRDKDVKAARANGIMALGAAFGYCPEEEWAHYDWVFQCPADLICWAKEQK